MSTDVYLEPSLLEVFKFIEDHNNIKLSKYQKLLLSEVATVEQMLSIITNSPIIVEIMSRITVSDCVTRKVRLKDKDNNILINATTKYNPSLLPYSMKHDLIDSDVGIGASIKKYELSTFRRIIGIGYDSKQRKLYRKYHIIKDAVILFEIYEEFSIDSFK